MAENTKMPPNQDQRQRTPQSGMDKPTKPAGSPNKPENKPEIDPERNRTGRGQPMPAADKDRVSDGDDMDDDIEQDEDTAQTQRPARNDPGDRR